MPTQHSEQRYFRTDDCSIWVTQMSWLFFETSMDRVLDNEYPTMLNDQLTYLIVTVAIAGILLVIYTVITLSRKQRLGYSHLIMMIWVVMFATKVVSKKVMLKRVRQFQEYID